jgi:hypothetical protein
MKMNLSEHQELKKYSFRFYKKNAYGKNDNLYIETEGIIGLSMSQSERFEDSLEYRFTSEKFLQKDVKDPLVFSPVRWIYNTNLNVAGIHDKDNLKLIWRKYKDKHRKPHNLVTFMMLESLYFNVNLGMEYSAFSNSPYLVFFTNIFNMDVKKDTVIKGLDFILMPASIPVSTTFKCVSIDENKIELEGSITTNELALEKMLTEKKFREHARTYHYSKDFNLDSKIKVIIDSKTSSLVSADFNLEIKGEKEKLQETMNYKINQIPMSVKANVNIDKTPDSCIIQDEVTPKKGWTIID